MNSQTKPKMVLVDGKWLPGPAGKPDQTWFTDDNRQVERRWPAEKAA